MVEGLTETQTMLAQIGLLVLGLALAWVLVRFILRLTLRIFAIGCGLILGLGLCVLVYQLIS